MFSSQALVLLRELAYGHKALTELEHSLSSACLATKFKSRHERISLLLSSKGIKVSASQLIVLAGGGSKGTAVGALRQQVGLHAAKKRPSEDNVETQVQGQEHVDLALVKRDIEYLAGEIKSLKVQLDASRQANIFLQGLVSEAINPNKSLASERRVQIEQVLTRLDSMRGVSSGGSTANQTDVQR